MGQSFQNINVFFVQRVACSTLPYDDRFRVLVHMSVCFCVLVRVTVFGSLVGQVLRKCAVVARRTIYIERHECAPIEAYYSQQRLALTLTPDIQMELWTCMKT